MTDVVRYQPPRQSSLEVAAAAWKIADKIYDTDFVPRSIRGNAPAVLACMLAGHEAGIEPMQSLAKIHIIEGRVAMAAELMAALVYRHGHELEYVNVSTTAVTARGRRRGGEKWTEVTFTLDDAQKGGLLGKDNWKKWPRAMLRSRATAELCRMLFPDVLAGISYTTEELSDGNLADTEIVDFGPPEVGALASAQPPAPKTAKAAKAITKAAQPADDLQPPPAAARGAIPDLPPPPPPGAPEPVTAEPVEATATDPDDDWPAGDWQSDPAIGKPPKRYTGPQLLAIKLHERFGISGNAADARARRIAAISFLVGRAIESSKELTPEEITAVAERIDGWPQGEGLPDPLPEIVGDRLVVDVPTPEFVRDVAPGAAVVADPGDVVETTATEEPATTRPDPTSPGEATESPSPGREAVPVIGTQPDAWDEDQWRRVLAERKVKVTEFLREAQRLGATKVPPVSVPLFESIAGSGLATEMLGWLEDRTVGKAGK